MFHGFPIVLTADRTLTADYRLLFDGMLAASQTTTAPPALFARLLMPRPRGATDRATLAPLGLRRVEAALLAGGFGPEEVAVVRDDQLDHAIGPATRVIGVSSGEPAGLGMNSSTMTAVAGGHIYPEAMFRRLMWKVQRLRRRTSAPVVLGGPGVWQLADRPADRKALGVDHLLAGYAEENVAATFRRLIQHDPVPEVVEGGWHAAAPIPPIRGATTMGVVEISRGCGLGCSFCTIARVPMVHLPPQTVLADVQTNVSAGLHNVAVLSEDFFRYGADGLNAQPETLIALLRSIRQIPQVRLIQLDHANVLSVARYDDRQLTTLHDLLVGRDVARSVWVNLGVETASGELLRQIGGTGKMRGSETADWGGFCAEQVRRLCRAGFFPMVSVMIGLPGERDEHLQQTLDWVRRMSDERIAVFPVIFAPVDGTPPLDPRRLRPLHWSLIRTCYRLNFRWVPWIYSDNQQAAGVPWLRRTALQCLGRGQVWQWKLLFAWHAWRARP